MLNILTIVGYLSTFSGHHLKGGKDKESLLAHINLQPFSSKLSINNIHGFLTICQP